MLRSTPTALRGIKVLLVDIGVIGVVEQRVEERQSQYLGDAAGSCFIGFRVRPIPSEVPVNIVPGCQNSSVNVISPFTTACAQAVRNDVS